MMIDAIAPVHISEPSPSPMQITQGSSSFATDLLQMMQVTQTQYQSASEQLTRFALGDNIPVHEVVISLEKAKLNLQMVVEVRNKLLESYQEMMRIQL